MAIGISSSGVAARDPVAGFARLPVARARDAEGAREPRRAEPGAAASTAPSEVDAPRDRESRLARLARVERLDAAVATPGTARGIAAYLEVERGTVSEAAGGVLAGIDFYI